MSLSGRVANLLSTRTPRLVDWYSHRQAQQFESSGGRRGGQLMGRPIFRLTVVGRKSGQPHSLMLMLVRRGDDLLVCGSHGGSPEAPNWWKNLVAAGEAGVQVGEQSYRVEAQVVTDPVERDEAWALLTAAYPDFATYQQLTDRELPIAVLRRAG